MTILDNQQFEAVSPHNLEWQREPNHKKWKYKGFTLLILRVAYSGHLCGYVCLDKDHPLYGEHDSEPYYVFTVHGGVTFHNLGSELKGDQRVLKPIKDKWLVGFDCAHGGDVRPFLTNHFDTGTYRNMEFVTKECEELADQLLKVKK